MKKLILLSLIGALCLPATAYTAGIGGAETQGRGKVTLSLDQEFVFDRDLKSFSSKKTVDTTTFNMRYVPKLDSMSRTMLKLSYGLLDNFDVYLKVGVASDYKIKGDIRGNWSDTDTGEKGLLTGDFSTKSNNTLAYGFGLKYTFPLGKGWLMGTDGQYLRHERKTSGSGLVYDTVDPTGPLSLSFDGKLTTQEWHVAPFIAKELGSFTPYIGGKYSDLRMKLDYDDNGSDNFDAKKHFGAFVGTDWIVSKHWRLNIEGRFIDETAASVGIVYRF